MENKNIITAAAIAVLVIAAVVVWYLPEATNDLSGSTGGSYTLAGGWTSPWDPPA